MHTCTHTHNHKAIPIAIQHSGISFLLYLSKEYMSAFPVLAFKCLTIEVLATQTAQAAAPFFSESSETEQAIKSYWTAR